MQVVDKIYKDLKAANFNKKTVGCFSLSRVPPPLPSFSQSRRNLIFNSPLHPHVRCITAGLRPGVHALPRALPVA